MKILHVSFASETGTNNGGKVFSLRNYHILQKIYSPNNVKMYSVERTGNRNSLYWKISNFVSDNVNLQMNGLSNRHLKNILDVINCNSIDIVFIDSSLLGQVAKVCKKKYPKIKVITYFQNVEREFCKQMIIEEKKIQFIYRYYVAIYNEKMAVKYSDRFIALNKRDISGLNYYYGINVPYMIPISIEDRYSPYKPKAVSRPLQLLFIGSYFYANVHAINFFITEVLPFVDAHLTLIGSNLEKLDVTNNDKLTIVPNAPDLSLYFQSADIVVLPIFKGSGMKTKTCEAMMFGKYIIGTKEAFEGYEIDSSFASVCNTAQEFINVINNIELSLNFCESARNQYLNNYSFETVEQEFRQAFNF